MERCAHRSALGFESVPEVRRDISHRAQSVALTADYVSPTDSDTAAVQGTGNGREQVMCEGTLALLVFDNCAVPKTHT